MVLQLHGRTHKKCSTIVNWDNAGGLSQYEGGRKTF